MDQNKRQIFESAGWCVGTVEEFLKLSPVEAQMIEIKLALARKLKELRESKNLSQEKVASMTGSSQSRVAKLEKADDSVSLDLMFSHLLSLGLPTQELGDLISNSANISKGNVS